MADRRDGVFIWVTWLSKVMAGDQSCEWASWFKAHFHNYEKVPSGFDTAKWTIDHTRQLRELHLERKKLGEHVFVEGENYIKYVTASGVTVAGKPDLVATGNAGPTVFDVKTGQPKTSDHIQVMIYMYLMPLAQERYRATKPSGCVAYSASRVQIPAEAIDTRFISNLEYFLDVIAAEVPAIKVPGPNECRFCDIPKAECPERYEEQP